MTKTETFSALIKRESTRIAETLAAGGHAAGCDTNTAEPMDWLRVLLETQADIALEARFDTSDPVTNRALRRRIAKLAALCAAWDKQLAG